MNFVFAKFREANEEVGIPLSSPHLHVLCNLRPFLSVRIGSYQVNPLRNDAVMPTDLQTSCDTCRSGINRPDYSGEFNALCRRLIPSQPFFQVDSKQLCRSRSCIQPPTWSYPRTKPRDEWTLVSQRRRILAICNKFLCVTPPNFQVTLFWFVLRQDMSDTQTILGSYRMHRFRSCYTPIKGLTAEILVCSLFVIWSSLA